METIDLFLSRFEELRAQSGMSERAMMRDIFGTDSAVDRIRNARRNRAMPKEETLRAIASYFHVSVDYLLGIEDKLASPPRHYRAAPDLPPVRDASASDPSVELTALDLSYSMGPGTELESYIEEEPIRFDPVLLRRISKAPWSRLKLARGVGDSMQPTLFPGDVVMIDTTQTMLNMQDRVYAVAVNGAAAIKRLRSERGGNIVIVSDNPAVENYTVEPDELTIHGRVVWFGREL